MTSSSRKTLIQLLHVARRELGMDEETYRGALQAATAQGNRAGKRSASDMSVPELQRAVDHMKRCGFKVKAKTAQAPRPVVLPAAKKIRALWSELHAVGRVRDKSDAALDLWIKRETGVEALAWLDVSQASQVIERLKKWGTRKVERAT